MPNIVIENSTFERLQKYAKPLVDTPDMVINRALDALGNREPRITHVDNPQIGVRSVDLNALPSLKHTKILEALIDGELIDRPKWNPLVDRIVIRAMRQLQDINELRKICTANMVRGWKDDEGYRYLTEIDVSIQGLSANDAGRALVVVAQSLQIELHITFIWRNRKDAAYPGEKALLAVPNKS